MRVVRPRPRPPKPRPTFPPGPRPTRNPRTGHTKRPAPTRPALTTPPPPHDKLDTIDSIQVLNEQKKVEAQKQGDSISLTSAANLDFDQKKLTKYPTLNNLADPDAAPSAPPKSPTRSENPSPKMSSKTKKTLKNAGIYFGVSTGSGLISSAPFLALQASQDYSAAEAAPAVIYAQRPPVHQPALPQPPQPSWPHNGPPLPTHGQQPNLPPTQVIQPKIINTEKTGQVVLNTIKKKPKVIVTPKPTGTAVAVVPDVAVAHNQPVTPLPRVNVLNPLPRFQQILPACTKYPLRCAAISTVVTAFSSAGVAVAILDIAALDPKSPTAMMKWMEEKLIDLARHLGIPREELEKVLAKFQPKLIMAHIFAHSMLSVQAFRKRHDMDLQFQYPKHYEELGLSRVQHMLMVLSNNGPALYRYVSNTLQDMERLEPGLFNDPTE